MGVVTGVVSPAGPWTVGSVGTVTAFVDDGLGNADPDYAGWTAVLAYDMRVATTAQGGSISGLAGAVADGGGNASFASIVAVGGTVYPTVAFVPAGTWSGYYADTFTDSNATILARRQFGNAPPATIVGHDPTDTTTAFEWTDGSSYARIYNNRVELFDGHGVSQDQWYGYAWDWVTSGNNTLLNCRMLANVTPTVGAGAATDYGMIGFMPNFYGYEHFDLYWLATTSSNYISYGNPNELAHDIYNSGSVWQKWVSHPMPTLTNIATVSYEVRHNDPWVFVLIDGTYYYAALMDASPGGTRGPYVECYAEADVNLAVDSWALETFTETPPVIPPPSRAFFVG